MKNEKYFPDQDDKYFKLDGIPKLNIPNSLPKDIDEHKFKTESEKKVYEFGKKSGYALQNKKSHQNLVEKAVDLALIKMKIDVVEPLGSEILLYLSTKTCQLVSRVAPDKEFVVNDDIELDVNVVKIKFFDAETEMTII